MLIQQLLKKQQLRLAELSAQSQEQQQLLLTRRQQLSATAVAFVGSAPGLLLSFSLGSLFQARHHSMVTMLRSTLGLRWIAKLARQP